MHFQQAAPRSRSPSCPSRGMCRNPSQRSIPHPCETQRQHQLAASSSGDVGDAPGDGSHYPAAITCHESPSKPAAQAASTPTALSPGGAAAVQLVRVTSSSFKDERHLKLLSAFHEMCGGEFGEHEMEPLAVWLRRLDDAARAVASGGALPPVVASFVIAVRSIDLKVVGGVAQELYVESHCGLIAYIAVHAEMRGKGLAAELVSGTLGDLNERCQELTAMPLVALFADVLEARDAVPGKFDARARQHVWSRLKFVPLDLDIVYPGRLKHTGRYQLSMLSNTYNASTGFPADVLLTFIGALFRSVAGADAAAADEAAAAREAVVFPSVLESHVVKVGPEAASVSSEGLSDERLSDESDSSVLSGSSTPRREEEDPNGGGDWMAQLEMYEDLLMDFDFVPAGPDLWR